MITGGHRTEVPSSFTWYPQQSNVSKVSPTEASPARWPDREEPLSTKTPFHMDFNSKDVNRGRHLSKHRDNAVHLKTTPQPKDEASFISTIPMPMPTATECLDDDQILQLIEEKVTFFRAQMRAWKERCATLKDSANKELKFNCPQQPTPSTSLDDHIAKDNREEKASDVNRSSPEQSRLKDHGTAENVLNIQEAAAICPKEKCPMVLGMPESLTPVQELFKNRPTVVLHHNPSGQDYNSKWRNSTPSISSDKESHLHPVKKQMKAVDNLPSVTDSSKQSQHTPMASALETGEKKTVTKNSREKPPQKPASSEDIRIHTSQNSKPKMDFADKSIGSDHHMKMDHEQQFIEGAKEKVQTEERKMEKGLFEILNERLKSPVYDDISDDESANETRQTSTLSTSFPNKDIDEYHHPVHSSRYLGNATTPENVDVNLPRPQSPKVSIQLDISDDVGPIPWNGSTEVEISRPPQQNYSLKGIQCAESKMEQPAEPSPNLKLVCDCPFLVETDNGFEERPCPKCAQSYASPNPEDPSPNQRNDLLQTLISGSGDCGDTALAFDLQQTTVMDPEYEEDEWDVFPLVASDVTLEQDIVELDDTDEGETGLPLSLEPPNQLSQSCFKKIKEYDDLPSFFETVSFKFSLGVPLEKTSSEQLPLPYSSSPKLEAVEEAASEPNSAPSVVDEDSCDTDDSSDYPLLSKSNYLTVSHHVRAPSPLHHASDSVEEGEIARVPDAMLPGSPPSSSRNPYLPVLSSDEDEDTNSANDTTFAFTTTKMHHIDTSNIKEGKKCCKPKKKVRRIDSDDDYDAADVEELDQSSKLKRSRNGSSDIRKGSGQPTLQPESVPTRLKKNYQVPSSVSSKGSSHLHQGKAAKRKNTSKISTSDHITKLRRFSTEEMGNVVEAMPRSMVKKPRLKKGSTSGMDNGNVNTQNAKTKASKTTQNVLKRQLSEPSCSRSISTQGNALIPAKVKSLRESPLNKTLSLNGEQYHASSLPGRSRSQDEPQRPSPPNKSQVNSYSTVNSTPAKQRLVQEWEVGHVQSHVPPKKRRRSDERDVSSHNSTVNMVNMRDREPAQKKHRSHETAGQQRLSSDKRRIRQRRKSQGTALQKKTISDAIQLTQQTHRQAPSEKNPEKKIIAEGYKWRKPAHTNDFDWERERDSPHLPKGLAEY